MKILLLIVAFAAVTVNATGLATTYRLQRRQAPTETPPDAFCGVFQGKTTIKCGPDDCCSQFNFCGNSTAHCGRGCQTEFGKCDSVNVLPPRTVPLAANAPEAKIHDSCSTPGMLAVTLDDGHSPSLNAKFLAELKKQKIVATFFINGANGDWDISKNPEIVKRTFAAGHQIAHHTMTHPNLSTLDDAGIVSELCNLDMAIAEALGGIIPRYLRFPFLEYSPQALKIAAFYGYIVVDVSIDTNDWDTTIPNRLDFALKAYSDALTKGSVQKSSFISLQHEIHSFTADTLFPKLLPQLSKVLVDKKKKAYKTVTVGQCIDKGSKSNDWYRKNIWHRDLKKDPVYYCPPR